MDANQIEKSLWGFERIRVVHEKALRAHAAELTATRKTAQRLQTALDAERAKTAELEKRIHEAELEVDLVTRQHHAKIEDVERSVNSLDGALAETIRKARLPRVRQYQTIRDPETNRITEVIVTEEGSDYAVVKRPIRDGDFRIVTVEEYVVPHEDQADEDAP